MNFGNLFLLREVFRTLNFQYMYAITGAPICDIRFGPSLESVGWSNPSLKVSPFPSHHPYHKNIVFYATTYLLITFQSLLLTINKTF